MIPPLMIAKDDWCGEHPDFFGTERFPGCQCKDCKGEG